MDEDGALDGAVGTPLRPARGTKDPGQRVRREALRPGHPGPPPAPARPHLSGQERGPGGGGGADRRVFVQADNSCAKTPCPPGTGQAGGARRGQLLPAGPGPRPRRDRNRPRRGRPDPPRASPAPGALTNQRPRAPGPRGWGRGPTCSVRRTRASCSGDRHSEQQPEHVARTEGHTRVAPTRRSRVCTGLVQSGSGSQGRGRG